MEAMNELILELTSLADQAGESLRIESNPATNAPYASKYVIAIGQNVYYADFINTHSLVGALKFHALNLSEKIKNGQETAETPT